MEHIKLSLHKHTAAIPIRLNEEGRWNTASNETGKFLQNRKYFERKQALIIAKLNIRYVT